MTLFLTLSLKEKIYKASLGMVHGEIQTHPDLVEFLKHRNAYFSGDATQPVQKFISEFKSWVEENGYEPD